MSLSSWLGGSKPSAAEIRAEIWSLGARHHGLPLEGALKELTGGGVPPARAQLLRACVRELKAR